MPALTDARQRVAELTTLNELAQTLNRALDLRETLDTALRHIVELMGLRTGWLFLRDETGGHRYTRIETCQVDGWFESAPAPGWNTPRPRTRDDPAYAAFPAARPAR